MWSAKQIGGCGGVCVGVVVRCRCGEVCVFGRWSGCGEVGMVRWVSGGGCECGKVGLGVERWCES